MLGLNFLLTGINEAIICHTAMFSFVRDCFTVESQSLSPSSSTNPSEQSLVSQESLMSQQSATSQPSVTPGAVGALEHPLGRFSAINMLSSTTTIHTSYNSGIAKRFLLILRNHHVQLHLHDLRHYFHYIATY